MSKIDMNENNAHALTFLESPCLSCQKQLMSIYRNLICLIGICAVQQSTKSNKEIQNWIIFWYFLSRILLLLCFLHCTGILDLPWDVLHIVLVVLSSFLFFPQVNMSYFLLIEWQVLYTRRWTQKAMKYHHGFLRLAICGFLGMQVDFRTIVCLSL